MTHKTRQGARKAAHADLGAEAIEGMDFTLRNTGAGWTHEPIPPANEPARAAQRRRRSGRKDVAEVEICGDRIVSGHRRVLDAAQEGRTVVCRDIRTGQKSLRVAVPKHTNRSAAKAPESSKTDMLVSMMKRPDGATSKAMEEAASWKPESVRGLVGLLKKRGTTVESLKEPGAPTRYHIPEDGVGDVI